jgi:tRNA dimethylallyltransferase
MNREMIYSRIEKRIDQMLERGFLQEVKGLMGMGYGPELKPMQSLGYKQMVQFLMKEIEWNETIRQTKRDTRHYARRQLTWFKADPEIHWGIESVDRQKIFLQIKSFIGRGGRRA